MSETPKPDPEVAKRQLRPFVRAGFELFPLTHGQKIPRDAGWRLKSYTFPQIGGWVRDGGNVGIRLRETDLVIDVDPRNFDPGDDPFARLCETVGSDLDNAPMVLSGRGDGGRHIYFRKPADLRTCGKLDGFNGIDFRSVGGLVVAPGSVHPDTGGIYQVDPAAPPIGDVTEAPFDLLSMLMRPERPNSILPGDRVGRISNGQLAELLAALDPTTYGPGHHDKWFALMAACHDATAGHGLPEWLDWCSRDSLYNNATDEEATTRRWKSLTAGREHGASYRTLLKAVSRAGRRDLVAALDDSAGISDFEDHDAPITNPVDLDAPIIDLVDRNARLELDR